jgi:hypothetical protein
MRNALLALASLAALAGCATAPPRTETPARVIQKIEHSKLVQLKGMSSSQMSGALQGQFGAQSPAVAGALGILFTKTKLGEMLGVTQSLTVYALTLRTNDSQELTVLSDYPGFGVGDCVKVFSLEIGRPDPAIAYGGGCS